MVRKEREFLAKQSAIKEENDKRIRENQEKYDQILLGVISNYEKNRKSLMIVLLSLAISACTSQPQKFRLQWSVHRNQSTSEPDSPADRVELSGKNAEDIRNDYGTAQRLVEQYENLRAVCLLLVEVVEWIKISWISMIKGLVKDIYKEFKSMALEKNPY